MQTTNKGERCVYFGTSLPLASVLDGFDQHFQASVHFPLTSAVNKSQQQLNKVRMLPLCFAAPSQFILYQLTPDERKKIWYELGPLVPQATTLVIKSLLLGQKISNSYCTMILAF